jgi:hypothetical protein
MAKQKKQKSQLLITHGHVDINKLLTYKTDTTKSLANENVSKKAKKETPLFYNKPIHKAKKHDLL